ncbi:Baeyer-Villiger monooxygenase [Saccharopolyspora subtropica]|uniref:Baeyer-Villiger monooxygenase n=1 Tax=Saccharopolyspora thermophila TaxID=89367 RepID=A0A917JKB0_9PSEU|nr:NAD(P)/FAD-dependent oxidoreductase [Saccharopolyspora subtropica]GGI69422.1 Baeyer-Villiger monooxygenase [Saccharopolyspora subtropica]
MIGAGFAGIGLVHQLRSAGFHDVVVLERADSVGGAWRDNTYPGCTCDIPSNLYSYSFAPNPNWTSSFAGQAEILAYLRDCARRWGVDEHVELGTELTAAEWDEQDRCWLLTTSRGRLRAVVLVVATGPFARPNLPDIPGLDRFTGSVFHSADWDHDVDLTAQRIAVVGTGASAVQIVPAVAEKAKQVQVYQRTPPWVMPKAVRPVPRAVRALYRRVPLAQRAVRAVQYWTREIPALALTGRRRLLAAAKRQARAHLAAQVPDPELRRRLTPTYSLFCKRVLISSDYYPTLTRPHVELVTEPIQRVEANGIVTADGAERLADVIVLATGFTVTDPPVAHRLFGRDGRSLAETWRVDGRSAYLGTSVAGFPNLFLFTGPGAGTGHTSLLVMIEAQIRYVVDCLRVMARDGLRDIEVRPEVQRRFAAEVQRAMTGSVWTSGGCTSYYLDATGRNTTLWPGPTWTFRRRTARFDVASYRIRR